LQEYNKLTHSKEVNKMAINYTWYFKTVDVKELEGKIE